MKNKKILALIVFVCAFFQVYGNEQKNEAMKAFNLGRKLLMSEDIKEKKAGIDFLHKVGTNWPDLSLSIGLLFVKEKQYTHAVNVLEMAFERGNSMARYELAKLYSDKEIPYYDVRKAFLYFKRIAHHYNFAAFQVGESYLNGIGVDIDRKKAYNYFVMATRNYKEELPCEVAFLRLSECYLNGWGTDKNIFNAYVYCLLAKKNGMSAGTLIDYDAILEKIYTQMDAEGKALLRR